MLTSARRFGFAAVLALAAAAGFSSAAMAQNHNRVRPAFPPPITVHPDPRVQQHAANMAAPGRAYAQVPPYALGYNPYVNSVNNGPAFVNPSNSSLPLNAYAPSYPYGSNGFYGYNGFIGASGYYNSGPYGNPNTTYGNAFYGNYANPYSGFGIPGY